MILPMKTTIFLQSAITCHKCGLGKVETISVDVRLNLYLYPNSGAALKLKQVSCSLFYRKRTT